MGKTILKLLPALLAVLAAVYVVFDFYFPAQFVRAALGAERSMAGLHPEQISIPGYNIASLQGGQGRPLLLIHGFGADKDNWTRVSRYLTQHYHVIAIDLPCWGESEHATPVECDIEHQVTCVDKIVTALNLERVDLGGNSMGGWIAAAYAAAHPERVDSLWLLAPAGLTTAEPSDLQQIVRSGGRMPLIAHTEGQYEELLDFVFVHRPFLPRAVVQILAQRQIENADYAQQIFALLLKEPPLEPQVKNLPTNTLIVWGDHDRALHHSGADVLHALLPNSQVILMPDMGHVPMAEAPRQVAEDYIKFRDSLGKQREAIGGS